MTAWVAALDDGSAQGIEASQAHALETLTWTGIKMNEHLSAAWLPTSAERIIVNRADSGTETLTVHDIDISHETYAWGGAWDGPHEGDSSAFSHDAGYVASRRQQGWQASLEIVGTGGA